jgi:hypothetical protein
VIQLEQFRKKKKAKKSAAAVEQAKPLIPDVVEKSPPIVNTASLGDELASGVEPNAASTSSVPPAKYENGPIRSSGVAESQSNGVLPLQLLRLGLVVLVPSKMLLVIAEVSSMGT